MNVGTITQLTNHPPRLEDLSAAFPCRAQSGCSAGDRVSIDRDALRMLCLAAGNLCRKRTDKRVAAVRAALNRLDADWEQYRQNDLSEGSDEETR